MRRGKRFNREGHGKHERNRKAEPRMKHGFARMKDGEKSRCAAMHTSFAPELPRLLFVLFVLFVSSCLVPLASILSAQDKVPAVAVVTTVWRHNAHADVIAS